MSDILKKMTYDFDNELFNDLKLPDDYGDSIFIDTSMIGGLDLSLLRAKIKTGIKLMDGAKMPDYASSGDSGADLYILHHTYIPAGAKGFKVRTGVKLDIPNGFEVQVRPKSGVSTNTNLRVILGTVDSGYKGEVMIIVDNISDQPIEVPKHKAIAQMVLMPVPMMIFEEKDELSTSERGENGFGSTGRGI